MMRLGDVIHLTSNGGEIEEGLLGDVGVLPV